MTTKVKERIITIMINSVVTVGAILLTFKLNTGYAESKDIQKKIDSKLDKIEFREYKKDIDLRLEREGKTIEKYIDIIDKKFDEHLKLIDERINFLHENAKMKK